MAGDSKTAVPEEFWLGVKQFNQGEFYACHDTLEAIWMEADATDRAFYQGLLQIAVGLYHLGNLNWQGCVILLGEGLQRLHPYQPEYFTVNVSLLIEIAQALLHQLQQSGPELVETISHHIHARYPVSTPLGVQPEMLVCQSDNDGPGDELRSPIIVLQEK